MHKIKHYAIVLYSRYSILRYVSLIFSAFSSIFLSALEIPGQGDHVDTKDQELGIEIDIMNVHEVARYLRLSEAKIYKLAKTSRIPAFRLGKTWRFRRSMIDEWICKDPGKTLSLQKSVLASV